MYPTIELELDLARSYDNQPLTDETRLLIKHYLHEPSVELWDVLAGQTIMSGPNLKVTFWHAVTAVDPTFQKHREKIGPGQFAPWRAHPTALLLANALKFATH